MCLRAIALVTSLPILAASALLASPARAQIPTPDCNEVSPQLVVTPDGSVPFTVRLRAGPSCNITVPSVPVRLVFNAAADALIAWPPGQDHPEITGTADVTGEAVFHVAGAGCVDLNRFQGDFVVQVWADDILIAEVSVVSPDAVNSEGLLPTDLGTSICEDGVSAVGLSDAVFHSRSIKNALVEPCSKVTGDPSDPVNLDDAVALTPFVKAGSSITCDPAAAPGLKY